LWNSEKGFKILTQQHLHTHKYAHTQKKIIFVSYFFHIKREHTIKVDGTRNIQFITGKSLCVGIFSLIVTRINHRKLYYKSLLRRNGQGYKKCTKYIDNNFNPKDRRMENLFNCGTDTKISFLQVVFKGGILGSMFGIFRF